MPADPRAEAIAEQVRLDLLDQLRDLQKHGRRYIEEYVDAFLGPKTTWRPRPSFHPKLAELIRELAQDAALADRFRACGAASSNSPTENVRSEWRNSHGEPSREVAA